LELGRDYWIAVLICGLGRFRVWSMKRRHLADVLLKILGLSVCLSAIPSVFIGIGFALISVVGMKANEALTFSNAFSFAITDGFRAALGIYLIVKSQKIAEFWFKNEDE
jgi:hypothetical protein